VLIVEDEPNQAELIRYNLESEGYRVAIACDGEDGLIQAMETIPDIILLDWMIPKVSGIEVCRQLRKIKSTNEIPIILLTARSEESDKVRGLDIGADDYITKPYSIKELLARVRAALRRPVAITIKDQVIVDEIVVDLNKHVVKVQNHEINLGSTEFKLLLELMKNSGRVLSRDQLLDKVWGISANVDTRTVDVHIGRLRKSMRLVTNRSLITTVRGFGYSLNSK
jgi:two-component system phosphate regulon response regulator PhoB